MATIFFAHRFGTSLEPECKMYRLLADVLNDFAFVLDCLSPVLLKPVRVVVLSFSSVLRALCGVAAGSAKASLSAHFARWGNLGELNAKDSSQETVISLMGMLVGSLVVTWITTPLATWTTLILLLSIHLETNRRAVRAVSMRTLNRQRATLVYHELMRGQVPKPEDISRQERIFERDDVLRNSNDQISGSCAVGASMTTFLASLASQQRSATRAMTVDSAWQTTMLKHLNGRMYLLSSDGNSDSVHYNIVIKSGATPKHILTGWWHALALSERASALRSLTDTPEGQKEMAKIMEATATDASKLMQQYSEALKQAGWDLETGALETRSSIRVGVSAKDD